MQVLQVKFSSQYLTETTCLCRDEAGFVHFLDGHLHEHLLAWFGREAPPILDHLTEGFRLAQVRGIATVRGETDKYTVEVETVKVW